MFPGVHFKRSFGAKSAHATRMRTNELLDASVNDEEVVDELLELGAIHFAYRTHGLPLISFHVVEKM